MCGIAGYVGIQQAGLLGRMVASMCHRGPDDFGIWNDPEAMVGLGHRRLSIIDTTSEGRQPLANEDGTVIITFNGEIYNYRELRQQSIARGHRFQSKTDTEVLVHLYEDRGEGMLEFVHGMYAFAIWDSRRRRLFAARDRLGIKPFYYCEAQEGLVFASELKALLQYERVARELDPEAIQSILTFLWTPSPRTVIKGIRQLSPGSYLIFEEGKGRLFRWGDIPFRGCYSEESFFSLAEQLAEKLQASVRRQLVSDVPLGAFLSGGLDSSAVVAMMKKCQAGDTPRCFTIANAKLSALDGMKEDLFYARKVARELRVELEEVLVSPNIAYDFERLVYFLDEPHADPAGLNVFRICQQARLGGYKVLLSGMGGDDIFSGYRRHTALYLEKFWGWLPAFARKGLAWWARSQSVENVTLRRLRKMWERADLPSDERRLHYFSWLHEAVVQSLFSPELAAKLKGSDPLGPLRAHLQQIPQEKSPLNRLLYLELKTFLPDHNLAYTDRMSMAAGVEVRVPLLDDELVDFLACVPPSFKQRRMEGKYLFKKAMEPYLPREVIYREKTGFGVPLRSWLRGELRPLMMDLLSVRSLSSRGIFNPEGVTNLIRRNESFEIDASYPIFALMSVEMWCRLFLDRNPQSVGAVRGAGSNFEKQSEGAPV